MTKIPTYTSLQGWLISLIVMTSYSLYAQPMNNNVQDVVAPSATASSLGVYADIPVGHNSGVPNIGIDLHTIRCGNLTFPLQLSYHAGGIRPASLASWTGDFAIHPGSISRTVQGTADERDNGYLSVGADIFVDEDGCVQGPNGFINNDMADGLIDSEPDIFAVSIHQGLNFKFHFDAQGEPVLIPKQDVKILYTLEGSISNPFRLKNFTIIDATGVQYEFGDIDDGNPSIEIMRVGQAFLFPDATNWHLKKVTSADGKYHITFNYEKERYQYYPRSARSGLGSTSNGINTTINAVEGYRLSEIRTSTLLETITFVPGVVRQDVESYQSGEETKVLDRVEIDCGAFCKSYQFTYNYFEDNEHPTGQWEDKRLRLDAVKEQSCDGTINDIPPYTFDYYRKVGNENYLTNRVSTAIDHWGFANAAYSNPINGINIPYTRLEYVDTYEQDILAYKGSSDRETNEQAMQWGNLQKINYPMGGQAAFEFEANEYYSTEDFTTIQDTGFELDGSDCASGGINLHDTQFLFISSSDVDNLVFTWQNQTVPAGGCCDTDNTVEIRLYQGNNTNSIATTSSAVNCDSLNPRITQGYLKEMFPILETTGAGNYRFELYLRRIVSNFIIEREVTSPLNDNREVGGLRVTKITRHDGISTSNDIIKTYNYQQGSIPVRSSGILYNQPKYGYIYNFQTNSCNTQDPPPVDEGTTHTFQEFGVYPLSSFEGQHISYSEVREFHNGNGFIYYSYDEEPELSDIGGTEYPVVVQPRVNAGQLLYQAISKDDNGNGDAILRSETRTVFTEPYQFSSGTCIKTFRIDNDGMGNAPWVAYSIRSKPHRYETITIMQDGVSTTTTSEYNSNDYLFPTAEYMTNSDGKTYRTTYSYSHDYILNTNLKNDLITRNILLPAWKREQIVNGTFVDGSQIEYAWFNLGNGTLQSSQSGGFPRPHKVFRHEKTWDENGIFTGPGKILQTTFDAYDSDGNIASITEFGWLPLTYSWSKGRLISKTFNQHITQNIYHDDTYLLKTQIAIDGQEIEYEYDQLMRPVLISAREDGGEFKVQTTFNYHYTTDITTDKSYFQKTTNYSQILNSGSDLANIRQREYLDGLGRVIQSTQIAHSPDMDDVITTIEYDNRGRLFKQYEPFEGNDGSGDFRPTVPNGTYFTMTEYEPSPLNRTSSVTPPNWSATTMDYGTNESAISNPPGAGGSLAANTLTKTIVTDPEDKITITYKDKRNRVLLLRREQGNDEANTYFAYDDKDRETLVVPPGAIVQHSNLIFRKYYDGADNITRQDIPDKDPIYMSYSDRDLPVVMQDGKMAVEGSSRWLLTNFDEYGRSVKTGFGDALPSNLNDITIPTDSLLTHIFYDGQEDEDPAVEQTEDQYVGRISKTRTRILDRNGAGTDWLDNLFMYDKHGRLIEMEGNNHTNLIYSDPPPEKNTFAYDWADNMLSEIREHYAYNLPLRTISCTKTYDHKGRLKNTFHGIDGSNTQISQMNYTHKDELESKLLGINGANRLQKIDYAYNAQSWLESINQINLEPPNGFNGTDDMDDLFYLSLKYNEANSQLNAAAQQNGNISQVHWRVRGRDRQAYGYQYDFLDRLTEATYGEIGDAGNYYNQNRYNSTYSYDLRGNIMSLTRKGLLPGGTYGLIDDMTYTYQSNSNKLNTISDVVDISCIADLPLSGTQSTDQTYRAGQTISSTQTVNNDSDVSYLAGDNITLNANFCVELGTEFLADIQECGNDLAGFLDGSGSYIYDENGNMTKDPDKDIIIDYNYLNLPYKITFPIGRNGEERWIKFTYDASGVKLKKERSDGYVKDYIFDTEYVDGELEAVYHQEGRTVPLNGGGFEYQYVIADHLGNTRVMFKDDGNGVAEIIQENHYYSFGLELKGSWNIDKVSNYKFNGIERQDDFDLDLDMAFYRTFNSSIAKWLQIDPVLKYEESQYTAMANNPIILIDPRGDDFINIHTERKNKALKRLEEAKTKLNNAKTALEKYSNTDVKKLKGQDKKDYKKASKNLKEAKKEKSRTQAAYDNEVVFEKVVDAVIKKFEATNPTEFNKWNNMSLKGEVVNIEVSAQNIPIQMLDDKGHPIGKTTTESVDWRLSSGRPSPVFVRLKTAGVGSPLSEEAIINNTSDMVHGIGHVYGALRSNNTEDVANEYERKHFSGLLKKNK